MAARPPYSDGGKRPTFKAFGRRADQKESSSRGGSTGLPCDRPEMFALGDEQGSVFFPGYTLAVPRLTKSAELASSAGAERHHGWGACPAPYTRVISVAEVSRQMHRRSHIRPARALQNWQ